ncbi:uncharacterized protein [Drosophila virilis]
MFTAWPGHRAECINKTVFWHWELSIFDFTHKMHSIWLSFCGLLLVLSSLGCLEAAPAKKQVANKAEQLVRVYPINEEQYERLLKLTNGKNVISEARLTSAGFTSVRNTLDSGWHSLLRIMGLTTTSYAEETKIDIDGQPLCVMQRSLADAAKPAESEPRAPSARAAGEDDSVINCIVVLKRDPALEALSSSNPDFAPYWYHENEQQLKLEPQAAELVAEQLAAPEDEHEQRLAATSTVAPQKRNKSKSQTKSKLHRTRTTLDSAARQYGSPYAPPPPPPPPPAPYGGGYGSPFGGPYPYGGYNQNPYSQYNPYAPPFGQQPPFGPQLPFGPQPYYPSQFYGQVPPYNPYPYYEQAEKEDKHDDDDDDESDEFDQSAEGEFVLDSSYDHDFYK